MNKSWIDFKALRAELNFAEVLHHYGVEVKGNGKQHHGFCPLPNHNGNRNSPSFSANLERGIFQCFGCGAKGNVLEFAAFMEKADPQDGAALREVALKLQQRFCLELGDQPKEIKKPIQQRLEPIKQESDLPVLVIIAKSSVSLEFHDIKDFYEEVAITNVIQTWPEMVQQPTNSGFKVLSAAKSEIGDAKQMAVFVHGWRMTYADYQIFSQTMLKRLYWQGYKGKFSTLRWPTRSEESELFPQMAYITYNRSERIAFKSGTGTAAYLSDLRSRFPDYTISGCAHSMGGIVTVETLKELAEAGQRPVDNWVLMQAAVPAQCFDPSTPNFQPFLDVETMVPTPDVYRNYAAGITNALRTGGKIANFFNPDDFALFWWRFNQAFNDANLLGNGVSNIKPNTFYGYSTDGTTSVLRTNVWNQSLWSTIYGGYYGNGPTRAVTNAMELMPFVSRPRSLAVGAQLNVHGQIQGQLLNLEAQLGFDSSESDHSGQFKRNIQEQPIWPFYSQLKTNLFLQQ